MISEVSTRTAKEFLDLLDGYADLPGPRIPIFRGHADADWSLLPSALRDDARFDMEQWVSGYFSTSDDRTEWQQRQYEAQALSEFYEQADRRGLRVPDYDRQAFHGDYAYETNARMIELYGSHWPPPEVLEIAALAQHYGVPTRLLDWSRSSRTAAFFAAEGALGRVERLCKSARKAGDSELEAVEAAEQLAVWILDLASTGHTPIHLARLPYERNPNLLAQRGLFTYWRPEGNGVPDSQERVDREPLELKVTNYNSILENTQGLAYEGGEGGIIMRKVTLPLIESAPLLRRLHRHEVDWASLMPGYSGVAWSLRTRVRFGDRHASFPRGAP